MKDRVTSKGIICLKVNNIEFRLCTIEYTIDRNGNFKYVFIPRYEVVDLLSTKEFDTIPGLDFSLRKQRYERNNIIPTFISERVPSENRVNYYELLQERNMEYMDPIVYMIRSNKYYSGDKLYVIDYEDNQISTIKTNNSKDNVRTIIKRILDEIAKGNDIEIDDTFFSGEAKASLFKVLLSFYSKWIKDIKIKQKEGIEKRKKKHLYKGRKPIIIESIKLKEALNKVKNKELSPKEAAKSLGISIDKYYREIKKLQN